MTNQEQIARYRKIITECESFIADSNLKIEKLWKVEPMTQSVTDDIKDTRIKIAQSKAAISNCEKTIAKLQQEQEDCNC